MSRACCGGCGAGLAGRPVTGVERRQVFDLPPVSGQGDRASADRAGMRLRAAHQGRRPARARRRRLQYGPRIAAIIIYLYTGQFLSKKRTAQALAELFGIPLSSGTVAALTARAAGTAGRVPGAGPRADRRQPGGRVR